MGTVAISTTLAALVISATITPAHLKEVSKEFKQDCFWQLTEGTSNHIQCEFPARMTPEDRAEVRRLTRNLFQDASCKVEVSVDRALIEDAVAKLNHVFEAPPQPGACKVHTKTSIFPVRSTFSPRVVFEDGAATEATPGMAKVVGVSRVFSWPIRAWINRSEMSEEGMLQVINAYLQRRREFVDSDRSVDVDPLDQLQAPDATMRRRESPH